MTIYQLILIINADAGTRKVTYLFASMEAAKCRYRLAQSQGCKVIMAYVYTMDSHQYTEEFLIHDITWLKA